MYLFPICSYIQKITLNLIETLKTSIYNRTHTQNMKIHFHFLGKAYFQILDVQTNQHVMRIFIISLILLRAAQPNYFSNFIITIGLFGISFFSLNREAKTDVQNKFISTVFLKRYVCQLCVASKSRKHTPLSCIFDTDYRWKLHIQLFIGKVGKHGSRQKS